MTGVAVASAIALISAAAIEAVQPPISLAPLEGVQQSQTYEGGCGTAQVRVIGVRQLVDNFFVGDPDAAQVIVRQRSRELIIDIRNGLSDHNGVACVPHRGRTRLLIWSGCSGSGCGDEFKFTVVDVDRPRILAPRKGTSCDTACASALVGPDLPTRLYPK